MTDQTRSCWYLPNNAGPRSTNQDKWTAGWFHQWGTEMGCTDGDGNFSVAIVEDDKTHAIVTVEPERVHFGTVPE